ncbi:hypothetical protein MTR67_048043 [Solanum verrucosum]|uniref:Uncharacterized protein n=1 Tax=Solanum verrucosum TaxID=315347 RepID=A0AAF0V0Q5_SOLVR|nr:hypothetical protein MTR67_048043 [Solanum verrucosum]
MPSSLDICHYLIILKCKTRIQKHM